MAQAYIKSFLPRITPEEAGLPSIQIEKFIAFLKENDLNPHAFILSRWGKVFAEAYFAPYNRYELQTVYSLSKSFTSSAVGLAIAEGKLHLTDKVVSFFGEEELPEVVDEKLANLTVRDLLCMGTGQEKEAGRYTENWARGFLKEPIVDEKSGVVFRYNSMATYMCAAILKKLGIDVEIYIKEKLLHPLGIYGTRWQRSPQDVVTGGWGLSLVPELIIKFGNVLLNGGEWEGKQLLPREYIRMATSKQIDNSWSYPEDQRADSDWTKGYGFQFWRCRHNCFRGDGAYGQYCLVSPDTGVVFAAMDQTNNMQKILDGFFDLVLLPLQKEPLPKDENAFAHLQKATESLCALDPAPSFVANSAAEAKLNGKKLQLDRKQEMAMMSSSLSAMSFSFEPDKLVLTLDDTQIICGQGTYEEQKISLPMFSPSGLNDLKTFAAYTFEGDTLCIRINVMELLLDFKLTVDLTGETAKVMLKNRQTAAEPVCWDGVIQ